MCHGFLAMAFPINCIFRFSLFLMLIHFMIMVQFHVYSKSFVLLYLAEQDIINEW